MHGNLILIRGGDRRAACALSMFLSWGSFAPSPPGRNLLTKDPSPFVRRLAPLIYVSWGSRADDSARDREGRDGKTWAKTNFKRITRFPLVSLAWPIFPACWAAIS